MPAARRSSAATANILTDTMSVLLAVIVHSADVLDRDGAEVLLPARRSFQDVERVVDDAG